MTDETLPRRDADDQVHAPTWLGWAARFASIGLLALLGGLIVYKASTEDRPVSFSAEVAKDEIRQQGGEWLIPVDITNEGSRSADFIILDVTAGGTKTEVEIDMLGSDEARRVVVSAPAPVATVTADVVRYEE